MKNIRRIFVNLPNNGKTIELKNDADWIFNEHCYDWIKNNNIEDFLFIDITHEGIEYKLPISDFKFMY